MTTTVLQPSVAALKDGSDATYVDLTPGGDFDLTLDALPAPAGGDVVLSASLSVRTSSTSGDGFDLTAALYADGALGGYRGRFQVIPEHKVGTRVDGIARYATNNLWRDEAAGTLVSLLEAGAHLTLSLDAEATMRVYELSVTVVTGPAPTYPDDEELIPVGDVVLADGSSDLGDAAELNGGGVTVPAATPVLVTINQTSHPAVGDAALHVLASAASTATVTLTLYADAGGTELVGYFTDDWTTKSEALTGDGTPHSVVFGLLVDPEQDVPLADAVFDGTYLRVESDVDLTITGLSVFVMGDFTVVPPPSEPTADPTTEEVYQRLPEIHRVLDVGNGWVLKLLLKSLFGQLDVVNALVDRLDYRTRDDLRVPVAAPDDTSDLVDPTTGDFSWIPWMSQLVGVRLNTALTEAQQRAQVAAPGFLPGTKEAIAFAVRPLLSGTQTVTILDHTEDRSAPGAGEWYDVTVLTRVSERTVTQDEIVAAVVAADAKPAGVVLHYGELDSSWDDLEATYPTWADIDGKTWTQIEEAGLT